MFWSVSKGMHEDKWGTTGILTSVLTQARYSGWASLGKRENDQSYTKDTQQVLEINQKSLTPWAQDLIQCSAAP